MASRGAFLHGARDRFFRWDYIASYISYRFWLASLLAFGLSKVIVLSAGIVLMQRGMVSMGTVYLLVYYLDMLVDSVEELRLQLEDIPAVGVASERVQRLLRVVFGMGYGTRDLNAPIRTIEFDDVCFRYEEREVLHGFSLAIERGRVYAFVGSSGVGKSTLLNLMMRLYDPTSGSIRINGLPLRDYRKGEIAHEVCYLRPYEDDGGTVANLLGRELFERQPQVEQCCRSLLRWDVLDEEAPLDTLFWGERHALVLIRALATTRSVILLDEVFDAVDGSRMRLVFAALRQQGKAVIAITHDQGVMRECDQVIDLVPPQSH